MGSTRRIVGRVKAKLTPTRKLSLVEHEQLREWRHGKKGPLPDFVRLVRPDERLISLVTRRVRFGRGIQLQQVRTVPKSLFERQELAQTMAEIRKRWVNEFGSKKIVQLLAKARVLQASAALGESLGGRNPTVFQVLALTALKYGLGSKELLRTATTMKALEAYNKRHGRKAPYEGTITGIYKACRLLLRGELLLVRVEQICFQNGMAMDSITICRELGLDWNERNQNVINVSLQLLETAGLVRKMPMASFKHPVSVWSHFVYKNPSVNYPNVETDILRRLKTHPQKLTELHLPHMVFGKSAGSNSAKFTRSTIKEALSHLESAGLVKTTRVTGRAGMHPKEASLTNLGLRLLEEHDRNNSLSEWSRKLLLGEKETETSKAKAT